LAYAKAIRSGVKHSPFSIREVAAGLWEAKWEMLLPVVVLWALLGGYATTSESAAIAGAVRTHRAALHPSRSRKLQGDRPASPAIASRWSVVC
jgi:hypothetical protein